MMTSSNRNAGQSSQEQRGSQGQRGFGSMDPQRQREIAAEGGRAAHAQGNAHEFNSQEARAAGSKGGQNSQRGRNRQ